MMKAEYENSRDDIEKWSDIAIGLSKLKMSTEYAADFSLKFAKFMSKEDKIEMAALHAKYDVIYWRYWEKLIKKIRGI